MLASVGIELRGREGPVIHPLIEKRWIGLKENVSKCHLRSAVSAGLNQSPAKPSWLASDLGRVLMLQRKSKHQKCSFEIDLK